MANLTTNLTTNLTKEEASMESSYNQRKANAWTYNQNKVCIEQHTLMEEDMTTAEITAYLYGGDVISVDLSEAQSGRLSNMFKSNTTSSTDTSTGRMLKSVFTRHRETARMIKDTSALSTEYTKLLKVLQESRFEIVSHVSTNATARYAYTSVKPISLKVYIRADLESALMVLPCKCCVTLTPKEVLYDMCNTHTKTIAWYTCGFSAQFINHFEDHLDKMDPYVLTDNPLFNTLPAILAVDLYNGMSFREWVDNRIGDIDMRKKEAHQVLVSISEKGQRTSLKKVGWAQLDEMIYGALRRVWAANYGLTGTNFGIIRVHDRMLFEWAGKKLDQLEVGEENDYDGYEDVLFDRIDEILPIDLVNGVRTSVTLAFENSRRRIALENGFDPDAKFPESELPDTDQIKYITTAGELQTEGDRMHHCVGGYHKDCHRGEAFMYHVTVDGNETTVQLKKTAVGFKVVQHYGKQNDPCPYPNEVAVEQWLQDNDKIEGEYIR